MNKLSENDIKVLKKIETCSKKLFEIYKRLNFIEMLNRKNSDECIKLIDYESRQQIQKLAAISYCVEAIDSMIDLQKVDASFSEFVDMNTKILSVYFRTGLSLVYDCDNYNDSEQSIVFNDTEESINSIINNNLIKTKNDKLKCKYLSIYTKQ